MVIRKPKEINPTMKISPTGDGDLPFKECAAIIQSIKDIETKFGKRTVAVLEDFDELTFEVFINNFSIKNLNKSWGMDDEGWIGKKVLLKKQTDPKFKKEMILLHPED